MFAGIRSMPVRHTPSPRRWTKRFAILVVPSIVASLLGTTFLGINAAGADTAPPAGLPSTVSADSLPTTQINGVAYDQVIVGNTVYVTGEFTSARPAGSAAGQNETPRSNLLAYNLTTGALITTWAPTINAKGKTIIASADGQTIYVGGNFSTANGVTRHYVAAFNATTGALVTGFNPNSQYRVDDMDLSGNTLYIAGAFTAMGNQTRTRLAAVNATTGAVLPWAPTADQEADTIVVVPGNKVIVGGHFTQLNGTDAKGMGALDATTGAVLPWTVNQTLQNWGPDAAITSLKTNGTSVIGTGYTYLVNGVQSGNFEGTFSADLNGNLQWVTGCRGDHYDLDIEGPVVYDISHTHDCSSSGGNPQTNPWTYQHATAWTTAPAANGATNVGGVFPGMPRPQILHWEPDLQPGTYTGQSQAAWTIEGNSQYEVLGGEFPNVNNKAQYGLARFAVRSIAPNKEGPQAASTAPTLTGIAPGTLRVSWTSSWDRDNDQLTYQVLQGANVNTATVVKTFTAGSDWWNLPKYSYTDTASAPGSSQTYRIRVTDPLGNTVTSGPATGTVPSGSVSSSPYRVAVTADSPTAYWRLGEASGTTGFDQIGANDLTIDSSATRNVPGALPNDTDTATTFTGSATVPATTTGSPLTGPQTFSTEAWFKTTTTSGGKIVGFGDSTTGNSSNYDRHLYMSNDGSVTFGVYDGNTRVISSGPGLNDGQWHQAVGTMGANGVTLFIDGKLIGNDPTATVAQGFAGYWRVGGDNLNGWPNQPSSSAFAGTIDEVAIYPTQLTQTQIRNHYLASGLPAAWPQRPTDAYGGAVWDSNPSLFLRLDEPSGSTNAIDRASNSVGGQYTGNVQLAQAPSPANPSGTSINLNGNNAAVIGTQAYNNPQTFSFETWFKTTSTDGGRIFGFGNANSGFSSNYDRHLFMLANGHLRYGIWIGSEATIDSPLAYNDGQWHQAVVTEQPGVQNLYVDGQLVATGGAPAAQGYTGYWRVGADNMWEGANTNNFAGQVDEASVYPTMLSAATVASHYSIGSGVVVNHPPTAAFSSTPTGLSVAFDGTTSSDPDGDTLTYDWDFNDGTAHGTGATPTHVYAAGGTYHVTLTVADGKGGTNAISHDVTVAAPNHPPTAAFSSTPTGLSVAFDGTTSSDPDGDTLTYDWDFNDGTAHGTGATPTHVYAAAGTYHVTLLVSDGKGGTNSVTNDVIVTAPPVNHPPTAAFVATPTNLSVQFDASTSSDPDGDTLTYDWDWNDGTAHGTGVTPIHVYTAAGTYHVTLTVADGKGGTNAISHDVIVTAPVGADYANDAFGRTVVNGFGNADLGGAWTLQGGNTSFAVNGGAGKISVGIGASRQASLDGVQQTETEVNTKVSFDKAATGGGAWVAVVGRRVNPTNDYRAKVKVSNTGAVSVQLVRLVANVETVISTANISGITYNAGDVLHVRLQVSGTGTTLLKTKVWKDGTTEPTTWALSSSDTTAALQAPGSVGVWVYVSGSSTSAMVASIDDFEASPLKP
jgi:PKD repeat protein